MKLLRKGKVKEVYDLGEELLFVFTDNISVFDKIIPSTIPHKGEILCRTAAYWFRKISDEDIRNHFLRCEGKRMYVRKFRIVERGSKEDENFLVPLEFITRYYLAGSLYDRVRKGKLHYRELGFKTMPEYGERLPEPVFEITTKFEEYDRKVDINEAMEIGGISREEIEEIREIILRVDKIIEREVSRRGLIHVDGKKEIALGDSRQIHVVDTFGTMDEDRWWDLEEYNRGKIVELSKEFVRQYYRDIGYYDSLVAARERGMEEPPIPPLPDEMVEKVRDLYITMFERITGEKFIY